MCGMSINSYRLARITCCTRLIECIIPNAAITCTSITFSTAAAFRYYRLIHTYKFLAVIFLTFFTFITAGVVAGIFLALSVIAFAATAAVVIILTAFAAIGFAAIRRACRRAPGRLAVTHPYRCRQAALAIATRAFLAYAIMRRPSRWAARLDRLRSAACRALTICHFWAWAAADHTVGSGALDSRTLSGRLTITLHAIIVT